MKLKPFFLILTLVASLSASAYDFEIDGIYYSKLSDGYSVSVTRKSTPIYGGDIVIPSSVTYDNLTYDVTEIADNAFFNSNITSIVLPETIVRIGKRAFANSPLKSCNIPSNVNDLGWESFCECSQLLEVEIPLKITKLELGTFYKCTSLTSIKIPKNVMTIDYSSATCPQAGSEGFAWHDGAPCFAYCKSLKSVVIEDGDRPLSFTDTWDGAPSSGAIYAKEIFYGCPIENLYIGRTLSNTPNNSVFEEHSSIKSVEFGNQVTSIQNGAFKKCTSLTNVIIPDNVTTLGSYAFENCSSLENIYVGNGVTIIPNGFVGNCSSLKNVFIGNKLKTIDCEVFYKCNNLDKIVISSSELNEFNSARNTPKTVTFMLPGESSLFEGFNASRIASVENITMEYTGLLPKFNIISAIDNASFKVVDNEAPKNVGSYNQNMTIEMTVNEWQSTFKTNVTYAITPATLTVLANNAHREYKQENPKLSCTIIGFKNNETESVLTTYPTLTTTANVNSLPGTYPILPSSAAAQNYTFQYERGELTITKAKNLLIWEQQIPPLEINKVVQLSFSIEEVTSEPIFTQYDSNIISVYKEGDKWCLKALAPGKTTIAVQYEGNDCYEKSNILTKSITVNKAPEILAQSISLNKSSMSLVVGTTETLIASIAPDNTTNKVVAWSSTNTDIATVDSQGLITAKKEGVTNIIAMTTDGSNLSAICSVSVEKQFVPITSITIVPNSVAINIGDEMQLNAKTFPEDATTQDIAWSSSAASIVSVNEKGIIKGIAVGSATITAACGGVSAICEISVNPVEAESITLNLKEANILIGYSVNLTAAIFPQETTYKTISWTSSDESVAQVDKNGTVTGVGVGNAIITATCGNVSDVCEVTVIPIMAEIVMLNMDKTEMKEGESLKLTATVYPEETTFKTIEWSSSNKAVAAVDHDGNIDALSEGAAMITATCGQAYATCFVTVIGESGIENIKADVNGRYIVWDVRGIKILDTENTKDIKLLPNGFYIINGTKVLLK